MRGRILALGASILTIGPGYAWYALPGGLRAKATKASLAAAFRYARVLKVSLLPLRIHYFGLSSTLVLAACLVAAALLSGLIMEWIDRVGDGPPPE